MLLSSILRSGLLAVSIISWQTSAQAQFQIPNLGDFFKPSKNSDAPNGSSADSGSTGIKMGACALMGIVGAALGKMLAQKDAEKLKLSAVQQRVREQSYMLGFGLFGCAVGDGVADKVLKNLSEQSRKAQETAWQQAQLQTGPVSWQTPDAKGTTEIVEREQMPDGKECGTRRDVIEAEEGRAEPIARVCRVAGSTSWQPVTT